MIALKERSHTLTCFLRSHMHARLLHLNASEHSLRSHVLFTRAPSATRHITANTLENMIALVIFV